MAKSVIQANVYGSDLKVEPGATVTVYDAVSGALRPLWQDRDGTVTQTNPFSADANGYFRVYASKGRVRLKASSNGAEQIFDDIMLGTAQTLDVEDVFPNRYLEFTSGTTDYSFSNIDITLFFGRSLIPGDTLFTWHYDDNLVTGSGAELEHTGSTDTNKAGSAPDADGYFYDGAGNQFQVVGTVNFEQFGAVGTDALSDQDAITAVFAQQRVVDSMPDRDYEVGVTGITVQPGSVVRMNGSRILRTVDLASGTPFVTIDANVEIQGTFTVHIPAGIVLRRAIRVSGAGCEIGKLIATSADQQNNRGAAQDAAIQLFGDDVDMEGIETENFDNGVVLTGDRVDMGRVKVTSYMRGVWFDEPEDVKYESITTRTRSPNASGDPGHNGCLITSVSGMEGRSLNIFDAGEHGVRFGGGPGSTDITIASIYSENSGGTGVKFRCSSTSQADRINIGTLVCVDCGDDTNPISNQDGLILERVRGLTIGTYRVIRKNKSLSCHHGISIYDVDDISMPSVSIEDVNREGVSLTVDGTDDNGDPEVRNANNVFIDGYVKAPGRHGTRVVYTGGEIRRLNWDLDMYQVAVTGHSWTNTGGGSIEQKCHITGSIKLVDPVANSPFSGSGINANILAHWVGSFEEVSVAGGSTCHDEDNNNLMIRNNDGTWTAINS